MHGGGVMTVVDSRTPTQRVEDLREGRRRPLAQLVEFVASPDAQRFLSAEDITRIVGRKVGHDVTLYDVCAAAAAIAVRNYYFGDDAEIQRQQECVDEALDALLDLVDCDDCHDLHPADEVRSCDHGTFGVEGTYPSCWTAFHSGRDCPSERQS